MKKQNKKNVVKNVETVVTIDNDENLNMPVESFESTVVEKTKKRREKNGTCKQIVNFLTDLIESEKFTQKQLAKIACESIENVCESTVTTLLVDSKNPKYNKFAKLVVKTENNTLKFA
jgi:thiaminase